VIKKSKWSRSHVRFGAVVGSARRAMRKPERTGRIVRGGATKKEQRRKKKEAIRKLLNACGETLQNGRAGGGWRGISFESGD